MVDSWQRQSTVYIYTTQRDNLCEVLASCSLLCKLIHTFVTATSNFKQLLGDNHPDTLHTMSNLAKTYSDLGEHRKAEELHVIVLEKQKQLLGDNHPDTLCTVGNLANTYSDLGEHRKAKELIVMVLEKQKQLLGDNHPHTLHTMGNLAIIQRRLRNRCCWLH
ncbi:hypothetical protein B0H13DRAFT_1642403 [Mycena leptocephala]|nr:hypothetical protein B0H13DRAFT_1642403 [Mycena leptocephala]